MKVAIDTSPLVSGHESRGIGAYTKNLVEEFKSEKWDFDFVFFDGKNYPADVDLVHYPYFDLYFRTLLLRRDKIRIVTIHDVIPLVFPQHYPAGIKGRINFFFQKIALKNIDLVMVGKALVDDKIPQTRAINSLIGKLELNKQIIKTGFIEEDDLAAI